MSTTLPAAKRDKIVEWLNQPLGKRMGIKEFCSELHIQKGTVKKVRAWLDAKKGAEKVISEKTRRIQRDLAQGFLDEHFEKIPDRKKRVEKLSPDAEIEEMKQRLRAIALDRNSPHSAAANAAKIFLQAMGALVEKQEIKHGISADDIARIHAENRQWLTEQGFIGTQGVGQVQPEPPLLPQPVRETEG